MATIYISQSNSEPFREQFVCEQGTTLYHALTAHGYSLSGASCGGAGVCRGCMVLILEEGMECLACRYTIHTEELHVVLQSEVIEQHILLYSDAGNELRNTVISRGESSSNEEEKLAAHSGHGSAEQQKKAVDISSEYGIAIDLGTTTIASALVEVSSGKVLSQAGCMNRQARYGADVISRIQYACEHEKGLILMQDSIWEDIQSLLDYYIQQGYPKERISRMMISGNTTMIHFLRGLNVKGLSAYPFQPVELSVYEGQYEGIPYSTMPGKSAFIGGDITSGAAELGMGRTSDYELFIDLGTNGELCLLNEEQGICTSTSCGPAFAGSVTSAGVHGSTLLDRLAEHYLAGDLNSAGLLKESLFETGILCGEYVITQDTIRQIQLAKSAIRTGIELAAYELRIPLASIPCVYLAGGFGFHLNLESAYTLGLFPEEFRGKIQIAGNTSLSGAVHALQAPGFLHDAENVLSKCRVLDLSMNKNFQEFFLHRLNFPDPCDL